MTSKRSNYSNPNFSGDVSFDHDQLRDLLTSACGKWFEQHCGKNGQQPMELNSACRLSIVEYTVDIVKRLCTPSFPQSVSELSERMDDSFPLKLRPSDDEIRMYSAVGGKKKKTHFLSADKMQSYFKVSVTPSSQPNRCVCVSLHRRSGLESSHQCHCFWFISSNIF